jgi:uncharacterized protein (DUF4415 family)
MPESARIADKVLVLAGPHAGTRGVVRVVSDKFLLIATDEAGDVRVQSTQVRNYSSAARKAWKTMPRRQVGRPAGKTKPRVTVALRIDSQLWTTLKTLEREGRIPSRSKFVEALLEEGIRKLT